MHSSKGLRYAQLYLALFLLAATSLFAQSTGTIQGTVTDTSGALISGATITIHSAQRGVDRTAQSDSAGNYAFPALQPGTYSLQATNPGFTTYVVNDVVLPVAQTVAVNLKLAVASANQVITVTGGAPIINASNNTVGQVISQRTVQEMPLNGRHFLDLTELVPGSVTAPTSGNLTSPSRGLGANSFLTAGNREDTVNFMINGVNLNDLSQNQITFQPSIDTTSEFSISNSTYGAEYGRSSGSIVNVATRSGTNQFHGQAFEYLRNNYFDARNYFNRSPARQSSFIRNNFGGDLGGPIWRDHTFFFASYEGLRQAQTILLNAGVLNTAQRNQLAATNAHTNFPNILNVIPLANDPTGTQFNGSSPGPVKIDQFTGDLSHKISDSDQLHLYYAWQQDKRTEPNLQGNTIPGFGDHRSAHRQIGTINETHIFNSQMVNEARLGFNRIAIAFTPNALLNPVDYGINTGITTASGLPQINIAVLGLNFGGPSGFPQGRFDTTYVANDTFNYLVGKHSWKAGGEFRHIVSDSFTGDPGQVTFSSANSFVNGSATSLLVTPTVVPSRVFVNAAGLFIEDSYKIKPNFTFQLGFRWEWFGTPTEGANRFINFLPGSDSLVRINTNGYGTLYPQNYNYEPRVGFVWDTRGTGKTVLRGAYGYLADQPTLTAVTGLASNPPLANQVSLTSNTGVPVGSLFTAAKAAGLAPNAVATNFSNGYLESYNLNLQQEIGPSMSFQLGYIGSRGIHLRVRHNANQPTVNGNQRPYPTLSASSPILPGSAVTNISQANSDSFSNYNAMWFTVNRSFSHGLEFSSTYTWSKSNDLNSLGSQGVYVLQDNFHPRNNYGLSDFDVRDRFVFSGIWDLPFKGNRAKEGWQLANITQLQTGNPINVTTTSTYNGTTATMRPNLVGSYSIGKSKLGNKNVGYINALGCAATAAGTIPAGCTFYAPATGFGNFRRNNISGPGFADSDVSLQKTTRIYESVSLVFRADAFDFLNHASFAQPIASISATPGSTTTGTNFGQINATRFPIGDLGSSRQLQFALKLLF
jgi:Carboxypeptidase regulatory-like domain